MEDDDETLAVSAAVAKLAWPDTLPAQAAALRDLLASLDQAVELHSLAAAFQGKVTPRRKADIQRLLETMAALGQAERTGAGLWKR